MALPLHSDLPQSLIKTRKKRQYLKPIEKPTICYPLKPAGPCMVTSVGRSWYLSVVAAAAAEQVAAVWTVGVFATLASLGAQYTQLGVVQAVVGTLVDVDQLAAFRRLLAAPASAAAAPPLPPQPPAPGRHLDTITAKTGRDSQK